MAAHLRAPGSHHLPPLRGGCGPASLDPPREYLIPPAAECSPRPESGPWCGGRHILLRTLGKSGSTRRNWCTCAPFWRVLPDSFGETAIMLVAGGAFLPLAFPWGARNWLYGWCRWEPRDAHTVRWRWPWGSWCAHPSVDRAVWHPPTSHFGPGIPLGIYRAQPWPDSVAGRQGGPEVPF